MMDYNGLLNEKVKDLKPSGIRRFFDIAQTMDNVISLGVGEPDYPTPWHIRDAGIHSLKQGNTRYTANAGLIELREEISRYFAKRYELEYNPQDEILITVGGSEAIDGCLRVLLNPGDEVLIPEPSFVCYAPITTLLEGVPVILNTTAEHDFRVTAEDIEAAITPKTKALILPYPNNPTGAIMPKEDLEKIAKVLKDKNIIVISDEIYAELTYYGKHVSIASIPGMKDKTVVINGFSKAYAMTGWRLGYACGPKEIISMMMKIHQYAIMCSPTTSQYAAIEALRNGDDDIEIMKEDYNMRRRIILNGVREIGFDCFEPKGAFYIFPSIKISGLSSDEFCEKLVHSKRIAVVPGEAFGKSGEGFVRMCYCYSKEHIALALERIKEFLNDNKL